MKVDLRQNKDGLEVFQMEKKCIMFFLQPNNTIDLCENSIEILGWVSSMKFKLELTIGWHCWAFI